MKLGYKIILIYMALTLFFNLLLNKKDINRGEYSIVQYNSYRAKIIRRYIKSTILSEYIYERIKYWKQQPRPKPKVIEEPFRNRS